MGGWLQLAATDESTQPPQQTVDPRTLLQQCQRASRMVVKGKKTKNPPVLSHEFVIQNHADIVACVAMVFVVGLMFQISSPAASVFIALHHNVSVPTEIQPGVFQDVLAYTQGPKDIPAIFFYLLISVVMHAIMQEYLLDKVNKKLHLSKIKHAKFNESGQLSAFYITSIVWAGDIVLRENLLSVASLWEGYPHASMSFLFKFFFIIQLSYWLHIFPELYFQKVKRDDWAPKIQYACLYLAFILAAYVTSFTRVALFLLLVHYISEAVFHTCRILAYLDKTAIASKLFLRLTRRSRPTKAPRRMDLVTNDREGFLGNSSSLNFLLDVVLKIYRMSVYQWQHSCSDVFIFIPLPITLVFIPDKKTVKKVIKKVAISCTFLSYCRHS